MPHMAVDKGIRRYTPYTHLLGSYNGGILVYTNILMGILTHCINMHLFTYDYSTA